MKYNDFAEVKLYKNSIVYCIIIDALIVLVILIFYSIFNDNKEILYYTLLLILTVPAILYYVYRYYSVKNGIKNYEIYTVNFKVPLNNSLFRSRFIAFAFKITVDGVNVSTRTRYIFSSFSIAGLRTIDYVQKEVLIAYNKNTNDVVVVGPKY